LIGISNDAKLMNKVAIVGRLLSENKGIDKIIKYCLTNRELAHLIVCGKDGRGLELAIHYLYYPRKELQSKVKSSCQKAPILI
jgi:hypothetical protein